MADKDIHDPPLRCVATASFAPRNEDELPLTEGDLILVGHTPDGGWWEGTNTARRKELGWFPANHVNVISSASQVAQPEAAYHDPERLLGYPRLGVYEHLPDADANADDEQAIGVEANSSSRADDISILKTPAAPSPGRKTSGMQLARGLPEPRPLDRSAVKLDSETKNASWFLSDIPREQVRWWAKQLLEAGPVGGYIVREPDSQTDCYALVVKVKPTAIKNYLVKCELVDETQTFRLGTVRSRSLYRLCEKLAVMDSPVATRLLPGFFLNKKAALKKAKRDGVQVPGLVPDSKEQQSGRVRTPPPRDSNGTTSRHGGRSSKGTDVSSQKVCDDLTGNRRNSGGGSRPSSRERALASMMHSIPSSHSESKSHNDSLSGEHNLSPTSTTAGKTAASEGLAAILQKSLKVNHAAGSANMSQSNASVNFTQKNENQTNTKSDGPKKQKPPPPPVGIRTSSLSSQRKPKTLKPTQSNEPIGLDLLNLPKPPDDLLLPPPKQVTYGSSASHTIRVDPLKSMTTRPQSGAYGFGGIESDSFSDIETSPGIAEMEPIAEVPIASTPKKYVSNEIDMGEPAFSQEHLGSRVMVQGYGVGELRYVGPHKVTGRPCCGVQLSERIGDHDGTIGDDLYFFGDPGHGIVVPSSLVSRLGTQATAVGYDPVDTPGFDDGFEDDAYC